MIHTSTGSISPESMQMLVQLKELYKFGLLPLLPMLIVLCFTFAFAYSTGIIKQCVRGRIGWMAVSRFPAGRRY